MIGNLRKVRKKPLCGVDGELSPVYNIGSPNNNPVPFQSTSTLTWSHLQSNRANSFHYFFCGLQYHGNRPCHEKSPPEYLRKGWLDEKRVECCTEGYPPHCSHGQIRCHRQTCVHVTIVVQILVPYHHRQLLFPTIGDQTCGLS